MSRRLYASISVLLLGATVLMGTVGTAAAGGTGPAVGPWKGKTSQGFPVYLGVREGSVVTNVRLTYKDVVCGKARLKNRTLTMTLDESGHFSGTVYPTNGGVVIEGTFTGPRTLKGAIVAGEDTGLPNCPGGTFRFRASPID